MEARPGPCDAGEQDHCSNKPIGGRQQGFDSLQIKVRLFEGVPIWGSCSQSQTSGNGSFDSCQPRISCLCRKVCHVHSFQELCTESAIGLAWQVGYVGGKTILPHAPDWVVQQIGFDSQTGRLMKDSHFLAASATDPAPGPEGSAGLKMEEAN